MLIRALVLALAVALLAPAAASAGIFNIAGHTIVYDASPGDVDQIAAIETPTTLRFTRFGGAPGGPGAGCVFVDPNIRLSCTGAPQCPDSVTRTVGEARRAVNLHVALGRRALGRRARIQLQITRATRVGRVLRYSLARPGLPVVQFLCRPPDGQTGDC